MIAICFRNCIGQQTVGIKILDAVGKSKKYKKYKQTLPDYKKTLIDFIKKRSVDIALLSAEKLTKLAQDQEALVFWQKIGGDHYRYAHDALVIRKKDIEQIKAQKERDFKKKVQEEQERIGKDKVVDESKFLHIKNMEPSHIIEEDQIRKDIDQYKQLANKAYSFGSHKAEKNMQPSNPVRLSMSLNHAVFVFNVMKDKEEAVKMTEKAIEAG